MNPKIADTQNFFDLNSLNSIRQQSNNTDKASKDAALDTAAKQFEAIFMQMLLKSMRKAQDVLESDSPFNSQSTKFYRDMHDQQLAVELSNNGSLGLSELIVRQLGGDSDKFTPNSVLRADGNLAAITEAKEAAKSAYQARIEQSPSIAEKQNQNSNQTANEKLPFSLMSNKRQIDIPYAVTEAKQVATPTFEQPKDFVTALTEPAQAVQSKLGVPFEVVIAQAALETGWGQKIIQTESGQSSHNLFNIKADSRWQGDKTTKETLEFERGAMVKKKEPFRVYESITESVNDYINFLSSSDRYKGALENTGNVEHFLHKLQGAGYATDPKYAEKILGTLGTVTSLLSK